MNNDLAISRGGSAANEGTGGVRPTPVHPLALDELVAQRENKLPNEHPRAPQDSICVTARARDQIAGQKAPEVNPLSFWDHPTQSAPVGARRVALDASASYKLE